MCCRCLVTLLPASPPAWGVSGFQGRHRPKEGVVFSVRMRSIGARGPLAVPATAQAGRSVLRSELTCRQEEEKRREERRGEG